MRKHSSSLNVSLSSQKKSMSAFPSLRSSSLRLFSSCSVCVELCHQTHAVIHLDGLWRFRSPAAWLLLRPHLQEGLQLLLQLLVLVDFLLQGFDANVQGGELQLNVLHRDSAGKHRSSFCIRFASLKNPVIDQSKRGWTDASVVFYLQQASYIINNLRRTLPGCTLDVLKFFRKLEQLLIFFLCLLCGQTRCCWNGYSHPAHVRVRSRSWGVYATAASTNHGHEVQQVHPGLVGLGVSQREEGRQLEPHRVPSIPALKTTVTSQLSTFSFQIFHPGTVIIKSV